MCIPFAIKYHIYPNIRLLQSKTTTSSSKTHLPREKCVNPNLRHHKKIHILRKIFYCQFHTCHMQNMSDSIYRISQPIRRTFFYKKCDLNTTCIFCTEGKYYFQTYKYLYIYYTTSLFLIVKTTMKMILVAVTTIFWVSMMNKLYYGC